MIDSVMINCLLIQLESGPRRNRPAGGCAMRACCGLRALAELDSGPVLTEWQRSGMSRALMTSALPVMREPPDYPTMVPDAPGEPPAQTWLHLATAHGLARFDWPSLLATT